MSVLRRATPYIAPNRSTKASAAIRQSQIPGIAAVTATANGIKAHAATIGSRPVIPFGKEVAGHVGQVTDQPELMCNGSSIGDQPGVIDIAVVDGGSRIKMAQVCAVEILKRWMEMAIGGP
jgi:hypothetical protein